MISSIILKGLDSNLQIIQENEILELNEKSKIYGLTLNKEDVKKIITSRNNTLKSYGRIDIVQEKCEAFAKKYRWTMECGI